MESPTPLYFEIAPVELVVQREPGVVNGRVERFTHAAHLMRRLDAIGKRKLLIVYLCEAGQPLDQLHVDALNHYLRSLRGLRSFKRVCSGRWNTKWAWNELRERLNIPIQAILVAV